MRVDYCSVNFLPHGCKRHMVKGNACYCIPYVVDEKCLCGPVKEECGDLHGIISPPPQREPTFDSSTSKILVSLRIDKDELRKRLIIPEYLKIATVEAVRNNEVVFDEDQHCWDDTNTALKAVVILFVNLKSGGHRGPTLKARLPKLSVKSRSLIS